MQYIIFSAYLVSVHIIVESQSCQFAVGRVYSISFRNRINCLRGVESYINKV